MSDKNDSKLNSLEFSLDEEDLSALKKYHSSQPENGEASASITVADMEISWEDSLENMREERAKLNQQVLQQNVSTETVPDVFEQAVKDAIQEQNSNSEHKLEIDLIKKDEVGEAEPDILHDEPSGHLLSDVTPVKKPNAQAKMVAPHADSVSFKEIETQQQSPSEAKSEIELNFAAAEPLHEKTSASVVTTEAESPAIDLAQTLDFEKIKQEALARVQQKPVPKDSLVQMVNPAINFGTLNEEGQESISAAKEELEAGGLSEAQLVVANNKLAHVPSQAEVLLEEVAAANIPELNLAVPENQLIYDEEVAAEVITKEPVSLVGEAQLIAAIVADLQPKLEKIVTCYVQEEIQNQMEILLKNLTIKMAEDVPLLLSETLLMQIKEAVQRVKNPL